MNEQHRGLRLGWIGGVVVFLHWSSAILLVLATVAISGQLKLDHPELAGRSVLVLSSLGTVMFFLSVVAHELAHAFVARACGIETRGITLYLFGGATETDTSSARARDEFVIAIAGPLTNLVLASILVGGQMLIRSSEALIDVFWYLAVVNVVLAAFNMTPGLPLDGGRALRAVIWGLTGDFRTATRWAGEAGVMVGYLLAGIGLVYLWNGSVWGLWFAAMGWLIAQAARGVEHADELRDILHDLKAADVMTTPVVTIPAEATIDDAVQQFFTREDMTSFPVTDGPRIVGLLSLETIGRVDPGRRPSTTAGSVASARTPSLIAMPSTSMVEVAGALSREEDRVLVVDQGLLVGIISPSDMRRRTSLIVLLRESTTSSPT